MGSMTTASRTGLLAIPLLHRISDGVLLLGPAKALIISRRTRGYVAELLVTGFILYERSQWQASDQYVKTRSLSAAVNFTLKLPSQKSDAACARNGEEERQWKLLQQVSARGSPG